MPKRSSKSKSKPRRPKDVNQLAARIVAETIADAPDPSPAEVSRIMSAMGRKGGLKGGKARAAKLSKAKRKAIAKKAAETRWRKKGSNSRPTPEVLVSNPTLRE